MPYFLVLLGIILIVINVRVITREKSSFNNVLKSKETDINDLDVMIGEIRSEFSETILELQKEILYLRDQIIIEKVANEKPKIIAEEKMEVYVSGAEAVKEIGVLLERGITVDEICGKYKIGKGEVLLIKELYIK